SYFRLRVQIAGCTLCEPMLNVTMPALRPFAPCYFALREHARAGSLRVSLAPFTFSSINCRMQRLSQIPTPFSTLHRRVRGGLLALVLPAIGCGLGCDAPI